MGRPIFAAVRTIPAHIEQLEPRQLLSADLIKDINTATLGSEPHHFANAGGVTVFAAREFDLGVELWRTDGTAAGTFLLKDINPGPESSGPREMLSTGSTCYFTAVSESSGRALWKTDGATAGTVLVKDINLGVDTSDILMLGAVGQTIFFIADDGVHGNELWKSDGTFAGTVMVKDINPGQESSMWMNDKIAAVMDGYLYFGANNGVQGAELWRTDGTAVGTTLVKDVWPGTIPSSPSEVAVIGSQLYFSASTSMDGAGLWRSDGTAAGTVLVPGTTSLAPMSITDFNGKVLFFGRDASTGYELWISDSTSGGTKRLKDIHPGPGSMLDADFDPGGYYAVPAPCVVGGIAYFSANDGVHGFELWKTDGTTAGTTMVKEIRPGIQGQSPHGFVAWGSSLLFVADGPEVGLELYRTDGTAGGTVLVRDIRQGTVGSNAYPYFIAPDGAALFGAYDGVHGMELWRTDGASAGTSLVKDILYEATQDSSLSENGTIALSPAVTLMSLDGGPTHGRELWQTDGTAAGTLLVKDINSGGDSSSPSPFVLLNGFAYFFADDGVSGRELWRSNGTATGTTRVKDIRPGAASGFTADDKFSLTVFNGRLYFSANDGSGETLWTSDGTSAGTMKLKSPASGGPGAVRSIASAGGRLYFSAWTSANGWELWSSDGTAGGTALLADLNPGPASSTPENFVEMNGALYFIAGDASLAGKLWKVVPGSLPVQLNAGASPRQLTAAGQLLFFTAQDTTGVELWRSDGTSAGTFRVVDLMPGKSWSIPLELTDFNGQLYFAASGVSGNELYLSDGTAAGTHLVADLAPGYTGSFPRDLSVVDSQLYLRTQMNGLRQVWRTSGEVGDAVLVHESTPWQTEPMPAFSANGQAMFFAYDEIHGVELWRAITSTSSFAISGTAGHDLIHVTRSGNTVSVSVNGNLHSMLATLDELIINAGDGNDRILVDPDVTLRLVLNGQGGNDTIRSGGGNDDLFGGDGDDVLEGGGGADLFSGGTGNDTLTYYRRLNAVSVTLDGIANDGTIGEGDNALDDLEWIFGGQGDDYLEGTGKTEAFYGFGGNDTIIAGGGNDVIWGGEGSDSLDGGAGNDFVNGGWGSDIIRGGSGNDQLLGDNGQDWIRGDAGNDVVDGQNHDDTLEGGTGADWIIGGDGSDTANYYNRTGNLTITIGQTNGNDGEAGEGDTVWSDIEILYGGSGNDRITGTSGSQQLFGFDGDDTLIGGASKDWLYGGNGTDSADDDALDIRGSIELSIA